MTFLEKLNKSIVQNNTFLCIGLDPDQEKIPAYLNESPSPLFNFNKNIINATHDLVCAYKANSAFYEAFGAEGITQLKQTIEYIHSIDPALPVILDAKRADIGNSSKMYARAAFSDLGADAITVSPYLGEDALEPFFSYSDKGVIVLCKTSNPGSRDFQDIGTDEGPLYLKVAKKVADWHEKYQNVLMVTGATYPEEIKKIRSIAPEMFFLVPGIGSQGGDLNKVMQAGLRADKSGLIINSGRKIIFSTSSEGYAAQARQKASELKREINSFR